MSHSLVSHSHTCPECQWEEPCPEACDLDDNGRGGFVTCSECLWDAEPWHYTAAEKRALAAAALCWFLRWVLDEDERRALRWFHDEVKELHWDCYDGEELDDGLNELYREPAYERLRR